MVISDRLPCASRCPVTTIPALLYQDYLYQSSDFTWLAIEPTIWLQVSYNLSVITACIPSMKNIFDNLSGNFSASIDVPYHLSTITGKSGCRATARDGSSQWTMGSHGLKLSPAHPSLTSCYTSDGSKSGTRTKDHDGQGESVRNLTDGIVMITEEVDIQFENRSPSPDGPHSPWHSTDRRMTE